MQKLHFRMKSILLLSNLSMEKKLIVVFVFLIIIPILIVGYVSYDNYAYSMRKNTTLYASQLSANITKRLEDYISDMEQISQVPLYLTSYQQILENENLTISQKQYELDNEIRILNKIKRGTNSIYIIDSHNNKFYNIVSGGVRLDLEERAVQWSELAGKANGKPVLLSTQPLNTAPQGNFAFTVIRAIKDYYTQEIIGTIAVDASISVIREVVKELQASGNGKVLIVDRNNNIIYDTDPKRISENASNDAVVSRASGLSGDFIETMDGVSYMIIYTMSEMTGWKTIIRIPLEEITRDAVQTQKIVVVITALTVTLALLISVLYSFALTNPLRRLMALMKQVQKGDLDVSFNIDSKDEAGRLGLHFNQMVGRIKQLIDTVYRIENRKKEAELVALQNQINPHFVHNTLETIRMTAEMNDDEEAAEMIASFGKMLRHSMYTIKGKVPLKEEFEYLRNYIQVINYRYSHTITLTLPDYRPIGNFLVMPLLFQPVVENAILHGQKLEVRSIAIEISYSIDSSSKRMIFVIRDNGQGMEPERVAELNAQLRQGMAVRTGQDGGIGMQNVNERVKLLYGGEYGLHLESRIHEGTEVKIALPYPLPEPAVSAL